MNRKKFLKNSSVVFLLLAGGKIVKAGEGWINDAAKKKLKLRFVVASDGHYGQPETEFDNFFTKVVNSINKEHQATPFEFCVINGDIIHNEKQLLLAAKEKIDRLAMPYYVTKGNHDMVSDDYWNETWKMPVNHAVVIKKTAIILATTSNEKGEYLAPDLNWMKEKLDESRHLKNVFIFIHIPQTKWTKNAIETPAFFELLKKYSNIKAVFHGHEHDQDGVKEKDNVPYLFDAHFGGNWGTGYKGFRVVELYNDNTVATYIMNPVEKINVTQL
jgi:DNA repair exonuclease SbcCD nuclease subunit